MINNAQKAKRREGKRLAVECIVKCALACPKALRSGNVDEKSMAKIQELLHAFLSKIDTQDNTEMAHALRTGKGCKQPPPAHATSGLTTFYAFVKLGLGSSVAMGGAKDCMHGYLHDGLAWCKQIHDANPNSEIPWSAHKAELKNAKDNYRATKLDFILNPMGDRTRMPEDEDEAFYWLIFKAGYIYEYEVELPEEKGPEQEKEVIERRTKDAALVLWKAQYAKLKEVDKNKEMLGPTEILKAATLFKNGLDHALNLYEKFYKEPEKFRQSIMRDLAKDESAKLLA